MNLIENLIASVAPHCCSVCRTEGELLCGPCRMTTLLSIPGRCYRCHAITKQHSVCKSCKSTVKISHVWVATRYETTAKELLHRFKFERAKAGAISIAAAMGPCIPALPADKVLVCHIPTANSRVRFRGYDQAEEIAKELCRLRGWKRRKLFSRTGSTRQVGAGRTERFNHLEKALRLRKNADISGKHILLLDDVTTTGATIEAAAKILKQNGARTVDAAVFAQP